MKLSKYANATSISSDMYFDRQQERGNGGHVPVQSSASDFFSELGAKMTSDIKSLVRQEAPDFREDEICIPFLCHIILHTQE